MLKAQIAPRPSLPDRCSRVSVSGKPLEANLPQLKRAVIHALHEAAKEGTLRDLNWLGTLASIDTLATLLVTCDDDVLCADGSEISDPESEVGDASGLCVDGVDTLGLESEGDDASGMGDEAGDMSGMCGDGGDMSGPDSEGGNMSDPESAGGDIAGPLRDEGDASGPGPDRVDTPSQESDEDMSVESAAVPDVFEALTEEQQQQMLALRGLLGHGVLPQERSRSNC